MGDLRTPGLNMRPIAQIGDFRRPRPNMGDLKVS